MREDTTKKLLIAGGVVAAVGLLIWAIRPSPVGPTTQLKRSIVAIRSGPEYIFKPDETVTIPAGSMIEVLGPDGNGDIHFVWNGQNFRTSPSSLS